MAKSEDKAIKNRIIEVIEYRLSSIKYNIYDLNKGRSTITREKILQKLEADKRLLEDCLTWISAIETKNE